MAKLLEYFRYERDLQIEAEIEKIKEYLGLT